MYMKNGPWYMGNILCYMYSYSSNIFFIYKKEAVMRITDIEPVLSTILCLRRATASNSIQLPLCA